MNHIDSQPEIEWSMRPPLIDFLIYAHKTFGLQSEMLFLTINLLDRFCSKVEVYKRDYLLAGCVAMTIATKYSERPNVPKSCDLHGLCGGFYDQKLFAQYEKYMLYNLRWVIGHPTVNSFLL